jgi:hypothetical protein
MDPIKESNGLTGLIGLQVADQVPLSAPSDPWNLILCFLNSILSKMPDSSREGLLNPCRPHCLCHGNEGDRFRLPPDPQGCLFNTSFDDFYILCNRQQILTVSNRLAPWQASIMPPL